MTGSRALLWLYRILLTTTVAASGPIRGQTILSPVAAEDSIVRLLAGINATESDSIRYVLNGKLSGILAAGLMADSTDTYPFSRLRTISNLVSPDGEFRIATWNLPDRAGNPVYFGWLKWKQGGQTRLMALEDISARDPLPDTAVAGPDNWFGALYYKIVPLTDPSGNRFYTLLGWSGKDAFITRKVIEVIRFKENGDPVFGARIFHGYSRAGVARVIFRYSSQASMSLKHEKLEVADRAGWDKKRRSFGKDLKSRDVLLFDDLIPLESQFEGQYRFYYPSGESCNAFVYTSAWFYVSPFEPCGRVK